jgi:DNA invertase Pin-like site-specific DNA recombinase
VSTATLSDWVLGLSPVAAFVAGMAASLVSRRWRRPATPDVGTVTASAQHASAAPAPLPPAPQRRALGYVCVARDAIVRDLSAYSAVIEEWIEAHHMRLIKIVHDIEPDNGRRGSGPGLCWALERIAAGEADALVTARLEHLSPSVAQLTPILRWFTGQGRTLVAIDFQLNTSTDAGRLAATALAGVGGWERERLSVRTRRGLEAARARGSALGRAAVGDVPELRERIARMRAQGMTLQAIADVLNEEGVATLRGGAMWRPSSVQRATGYRRPSSAPRTELPGSQSIPDTNGDLVRKGTDADRRDLLHPRGGGSKNERGTTQTQ